MRFGGYTPVDGKPRLSRQNSEDSNLSVVAYHKKKALRGVEGTLASRLQNVRAKQKAAVAHQERVSPSRHGEQLAVPICTVKAKE